jgi:protein tyrosine phosphatase
VQKLIGEVKKNAREKIIVSLEEYRSHRFCDCRIYWDDNGTWKPSKKGISLNGENIDEVIELLKKASDIMEG